MYVPIQQGKYKLDNNKSYQAGISSDQVCHHDTAKDSAIKKHIYAAANWHMNKWNNDSSNMQGTRWSIAIQVYAGKQRHKLQEMSVLGNAKTSDEQISAYAYN